MSQLSLSFPPGPGFDARDFVVSKPNLDAWTRLADWPGPEGGALALIGPAGVGKSHLASIWAQRTGARRVDPCAAVMEALAEAPPFLLVENADQGFADATLFHLINLGLRPGGGLLITARTPPAAWPTQLPDLRSRLNALPVLTLDEPDDAILEGMLQTFFRQRRILPAQDLLNYLVRRIERSASAAEATVQRLDAAAAAAQRPVSRRLAQDLFADISDDEDGGDAEAV